MHAAHLAELLAPFLTAPLSHAQLAALSTYLEILLRWNARTNLTSVRAPDDIVTRHFGESLFAAQVLFPLRPEPYALRLLDVGSGAGFPGLPIKLWAPDLHVTLIESQNKKATFLKEVIRALQLRDIDVFSARAEHFAPSTIDRRPSTIDHRPSTIGHRPTTVSLRAVEKFDRILPLAATLAPHPRLALLIGAAQADSARALLPHFTWSAPLPIPLSVSRILLIGESD